MRGTDRKQTHATMLMCKVAWILALGWSEAGSEPPKRDIDTILRSLRKNMHCFDMHGNACAELRALLKVRFLATAAITREIDATEAGAHRAYVGPLYYALAYVNDPNVINWLDGKLDGPRADEVYEFWFGPPLLMRSLRVYYNRVKWLEGDEMWSHFFRSRVRKTTNARHRMQLLREMHYYLHDRLTIEFFEGLARNTDADVRERLLAMCYSRVHRRPVNGAALMHIIGEIAPSREPILEEACRVMRHEAFIPWLLSGKVEAASVERLLKCITFRRDISGLNAWRSWYEKHRGETHEQWVDVAMKAFERELQNDPQKALGILVAETYHWYEPGLHRYVSKWLEHKILHRALVTWLRFSSHPFWYEQLLPIAQAIVRESRETLNEDELRFLRGFDVIEGDTWERWCSRCCAL